MDLDFGQDCHVSPGPTQDEIRCLVYYLLLCLIIYIYCCCRLPWVINKWLLSVNRQLDVSQTKKIIRATGTTAVSHYALAIHVEWQNPWRVGGGGCCWLQTGRPIWPCMGLAPPLPMSPWVIQWWPLHMPNLGKSHGDAAVELHDAAAAGITDNPLAKQVCGCHASKSLLCNSPGMHTITCRPCTKKPATYRCKCRENVLIPDFPLPVHGRLDSCALGLLLYYVFIGFQGAIIRF